ncbi:MAG: YlmC/YmxH family sporulation protein [Bacillota bacterium]
MKLNQLMGKEIINLADGEKLGSIAEVDITFDQQTGSLKSILVPVEKGVFNFLGEDKFFEVPWESIIKIGQEVVIINLKTNQ